MKTFLNRDCESDTLKYTIINSVLLLLLLGVAEASFIFLTSLHFLFWPTIFGAIWGSAAFVLNKCIHKTSIFAIISFLIFNPLCCVAFSGLLFSDPIVLDIGIVVNAILGYGFGVTLGYLGVSYKN